ncbi:COMPASS-like H3K4 histone methylase component WDR5A [Gracilariopsis chorda]|uniref:COMPASS-like H3K4 histone methylase component WDR5A n=1 Tax=Gracilariopsis chorda TaxID=448386 RepID=A0A2V3ICN8_9FLOR|nr:COMPASS-like H3K4 histone methylase component WDR5A [Gracilariopsis chorda]|eukprot:PXF39798.1 COMPASS-like H3K4 histone methylase component WDR5A [Gracilariopsis chorda]
MSGDGSTVAYDLQEGRVYVWNVKRQKELGNPLEAPQVDENLGAIDLSFDAKQIVCHRHISCRDAIHVLDMEIGDNMAAPLGMENDYVFCVAICTDGKRVLSGLNDGRIRIWNISSTGSVQEPIHGHTDRVCRVVSRDGKRIISVSSYKTMRFWDAERNVMLEEPLEVELTGTIAVNSDGTEIVTTISRDAIRVFDVENMNASLYPKRYTGRINCVACDSNIPLVTGFSDGCVRVWHAQGRRTGTQVVRTGRPQGRGDVFCDRALQKNM